MEALFGDGGGGGEDGFRAVMRIVKLNSAIQNRSVRELLELLADECRYFCRNIPPVSVSEMSKVPQYVSCLLLLFSFVRPRRSGC